MPCSGTMLWISVTVMTVVLFWGIGLIARALTGSTPGDSKAPLIRSMLSESTTRPDQPDKGSFSRTAGAFGAMGLAACTVGLSYWVLFDVFGFNGDHLGKLKDAGWFFLGGSALFAPYAFNQLSKVFGVGSS